MRLLLALSLSASVYAQSPVIGMNNFIHATDDLQKTVAFYRDVFGLAQPPAPRPPNPAVPALINAPGAQLQVAVLRIPNSTFGFELTYFGGIERKAGQPRHTDPGAGTLTVRVRDIDPIFAALKKANATIITSSGAPVALAPSVRSIMVRDPDGFIIEVLQVPGEGTGNILGATMGITVDSIEAAQKFYGDLLGFEFTGKPEFASGRSILDLTGSPASAQYRQTSSTIPGTKSQINFYEFKDLPRKSFRQRVPDPGTPAIALRVTDLDALLKRLKAAGVKVISAGGEPAQFSSTIRNIFIEDPSGFKIELYQSAQ